MNQTLRFNLLMDKLVLLLVFKKEHVMDFTEWGDK